MKNPERRTSITFSGKSNEHSEAYEKHPLSSLSQFSSSSSSSITSPSSTSLSVPPRLSQVSQIRCRLLYRLGIDPKQPVQKYTKPTLITKSNTNCTKNVPKPFLRPLRDNLSTFGTAEALDPDSSNHQYVNNDNSDTKNRNFSFAENHRGNNVLANEASTATTPERRMVRFDDNVLVVPIPSRHAYSDRMKKALWRNRIEIKDIVDRNRYEYLSEGWEWTRVLEEEEMYLDVATGEKIHPCWVEDDDGDGHECRDSFDDDTRADIETPNLYTM